MQDAPPTPIDVVHASILLHFGDLVRELGGDPAAIMARSGHPPDLPQDGDAQVSYRLAIDLMEVAAAELACPDFGLRLAEKQGGIAMFGPLGTVMRHSRTFGEALEYVCTHNAAHSLAARVWLKRLSLKGAIFVGHDILLDGVVAQGQSIEQVLLAGQLAAIELTHGKARMRRVHFRHQPSMPLASYRRRFGCDVLFGQKGDGAFFSEEDFASPIVDPNARTYAAAVAYIDAQFGDDRPPTHTQVRGFVMQHLGTRHCTNAGIAAELGVQKRVLHRRLCREGTSFQKIKDEVRRDLMLYYLLRTEIDFARVSEKLGFAEQSVMTRSCHRWLAASPTAIRRSARSDAAGRRRPAAQPKSSSMPS